MRGVLQVAHAAHGFVSQRSGQRRGANLVQQGKGELRVARGERLGGHPDEVVQQEVRGGRRGGDECGKDVADFLRVRFTLRLGVHRERAGGELAASGGDGDAHGGFAVGGELAEEREVFRVAKLLLADEPRGPSADGGFLVSGGFGELVVCEIAGAVQRPERREAGFERLAARELVLQQAHHLVVAAVVEDALGHLALPDVRVREALDELGRGELAEVHVHLWA